MSIITNPPGLLSTAAITAGYTPCDGAALASDAAADDRCCSDPLCPNNQERAAKTRNYGKEIADAANAAVLQERVDALAESARQLRDAELALKAARENYGAKLRAFNEFVAPVAR